MTTGEVVEDEINPHPGMLKVMIQLMKLRVIVLLQVTAICAILVHDSLARYDLIQLERTWADTVIA
jgi:heme O synthase-like polyprenyltransferase